ncbi:Crp/Fnr family transcriptional regulator [Listeria booriae]|uniref:Crp/Fnr family transcriptional regulator n=2 Tax=Listeria booriae TaxID=1552123 RepID=A0A842G3J8_9LIST|nr:Crp/Fnr family transcriptional regulator [Listeria booriae]MBC2285444.1 Crp/Fnr family transcriptional regulator [Listeria booriae]MBC2294879.1 Crp/Fnr family transcriptional regulator [Listeria booriae]
MKNQTLAILEDLIQNTPNSNWITIETVDKKTIIDNQKLYNDFLIILDGTLHLENKNSQILHFFTNSHIIYHSPFDLGIENQLRIIANTDMEVAFVNREFFLNFAANKPSYMEWLLTAVLRNSSGLCFELMKHDLPTEPRITYTLQSFCDTLDLQADDDEEEYVEIPSYLNKSKLAHYGNVSRKNLNEKLDILEEKEEVKRADNKLYIRVESL